jgi:hypothetical protein
MDSLAYVLGFGSKNELVAFIKKQLDLITYISLDDGHILHVFSDVVPVYNVSNYKQSSIYKEWHNWAQKNKKYTAHLTITSDMQICRELAIYASYRNFIKHLASNDIKNPHHLYDLLSRLGVFAVIWKRQTPSTAAAVCPAFSSVDDILAMSNTAQKVAMLLVDDDGHYEPLVAKQRSKNGVALFPLDSEIGNKVSSLLKDSCKPPQIQHMPHMASSHIVGLLRTLHVWTQMRLFSPSGFTITCVILRPDFRIFGFMTKANIIVTGPQEGMPIHTLPPFMQSIPTLKHIIHMDDITGTHTTGHVYENDMSMFIAKTKSIGL